MYLITKAMKYAAILLLFGLAVLFIQFDAFALELFDSWRPGTGWIAFLGLLALEVTGFAFLFLSWRPGKARLILKADPTDEEKRAFVAELEKRLAANPLVREAGIEPGQKDFMEKALAHLDKKASAIIRSDARKVFIGTALAQNGRLDALIVFVALARMVWRISRVYNQRPTPAEIWSVYTAVSSSAFVAFTLEALDIPQTVTETLGSLVPAVAPHMASTSMPFVGNTMHLFTASVLDGAANGLLAVRAGVITKNAFCHANLDKAERRGISSREIRSNMLTLSRECLGDITAGLKDQLKDMAGSVADTAVEKTVSAARTMATTVTDAASTAGDLVIKGGGAVVKGGEVVADAVTDAVSGTVTGTVDLAGKAVKGTAKVISHGGEAVAKGVHSGTDKAKSILRGAGGLVSRIPGFGKRKKDHEDAGE